MMTMRVNPVSSGNGLMQIAGYLPKNPVPPFNMGYFAQAPHTKLIHRINRRHGNTVFTMAPHNGHISRSANFSTSEGYTNIYREEYYIIAENWPKTQPCLLPLVIHQSVGTFVIFNNDEEDNTYTEIVWYTFASF